jgi:uncharacterized protein YdeI (YjbR/CyaY-like superfamily)
VDNQNPKVDAYINRAGKWQNEVIKLRSIVQEFPLVEDFKWGVPCYTLNGKNVLLTHCFKEYCAVLFVKGALLKNTSQILIQQTDDVQAARQARFTNLQEIEAAAEDLRICIQEAIEVEKAGLKVELKKTSEFTIAPEFQKVLSDDAVLKSAFEALTPGRQRAYLLYFAAPTQEKTRIARIEKSRTAILAGKGLND